MTTDGDLVDEGNLFVLPKSSCAGITLSGRGRDRLYYRSMCYTFKYYTIDFFQVTDASGNSVSDTLWIVIRPRGRDITVQNESCAIRRQELRQGRQQRRRTREAAREQEQRDLQAQAQRHQRQLIHKTKHQEQDQQPRSAPQEKRKYYLKYCPIKYSRWK